MCDAPGLMGFPLWVASIGKGLNAKANRATYLMVDRYSGFAPLDWLNGEK